MTPARLTSPKVGMRPTTPQCDAGMRIEPPVSEPSATGTSPAATAAPEPDDEPPAIRCFAAFRVVFAREAMRGDDTAKTWASRVMTDIVRDGLVHPAEAERLHGRF